MTFIVLLVLLQTPPPPPSAPPLVPIEDVVAGSPLQYVYRPMLRRDVPVAAPLPMLSNAILFSPGSLFGLFISAEYERRIANQFTAFVAFGAGPFSQIGFDLGVRLYPVDRVFESFFVDVRAAAFGLVSGGQMFMMGPMVELGYSWRARNNLLVSVGAGAAMWFSVMRANRAVGIFGTAVIDAAVFSLPGFFQPPDGRVGLQPTIRVTIGPGF